MSCESVLSESSIGSRGMNTINDTLKRFNGSNDSNSFDTNCDQNITQNSNNLQQNENQNDFEMTLTPIIENNNYINPSPSQPSGALIPQIQPFVQLVAISEDQSITPITSPPNLSNGNESGVSERSEPVVSSGQQSSKCVSQAVLICRKNSHPFAERRVSLEGAVKVGRAVARSKPSADNFIFDCKVLSRNHASLWFENQKFYLQDTRSSNGTFINNQRLSPANEESQAREVFSGDVVQFGVDVMENSRKVTHGCIIAAIRLYLPDGTEAKAQEQHHNCPQTPNPSNVCITSKQLYELSQCLSEAIHREQILENKLETLQRVVTSAHESANTGWRSLVEEDRLLSRIETLQNKLEVCLTNKDNKDGGDVTDNSPVEYLREEMLKLIEDKEKYESAAKEAIQRALEEKLIVLTRLHEFEISIKSHEEECNRLQEVCETSAQEINRLANINDDLNKEIESYVKRLKGSEDQKMDLIEATNNEKEEMEEKIAKLKAKEVENNEIICELKSINESSNLQIERLKLQLEVIKQSENVINDGNSGDNVSNDLMDNSDNTYMNDIKVNLEQELQKVRKQLELSYAKNSELSAELIGVKQQTVSTVTLTDSTTSSSVDSKPLSQINGQILSTNDLNNESNDSCVEESVVKSEVTDELSATDQTTSQLSHEINLLKELLTETRASKKSIEEELSRTVTELENLRSLAKQLSLESDETQHKLDKTLKELEEKNILITSLKNQINELSEKMRNCLKDCETIRSKIGENEKLLHLKDDELNSLRVLLEEERKVQQKYANNYEICRKQLSEQQVVVKQSQTETELLRKKVYSCNEELRTSRSNLSINTSIDESNKTAKELEKLQNECQSLKNKLHSRESELSYHLKQHQELSADYQTLQTSLKLLQQMNAELEARGDHYWREQFDSAKCEAQTHETQFINVSKELEELKQKYENCSKNNEVLNEDLKSAEECIEIFSYQSKTATVCAVVPLIMLLIAVLMAYYPSVSTVTGTTDL